MTDEPQLQVTPKDGSLSPSPSKLRSDLIARGRREAEVLLEDRPLSEVRRLAENGDMDAQFDLGEAYYEGRGVPVDYGQALSWFRKSADQAHLYANSMLGDMYEKGEGVPANRAEAQHYYCRAADIALAIPDRAELYPWDPDAALNAIGQGAEYGHADAQHCAGELYATGVLRHLPQDYTAAAGWYRKAADQGLASSQHSLGRLYANGQGVTQDYVLAHMWLNLSASNSSDGEQERRARERDEIASKMTPGQIAEAHRLAREWKPKSSAGQGGRP